MRKKRDRVIFDTNIWISYLISDEFVLLDKLIEEQLIVLVFSNELLEEFYEVAKRKKFMKYFTTKDLDTLIKFISTFAYFVNVRSEFTMCRDPKDNYLLSLSYDADATHLVTGDKDLLEMKYFYCTKIIDYSNYIKTKIVSQ